jgi:hypothetical protein
MLSSPTATPASRRGRVLALFELTGLIKDSGAAIRQAFGAVNSDFRDGGFGETRFFNTWQEALDAAGLAD